jgi:CHC2-type zinc finger protein
VCILVLKKYKKPDDVLFTNASEHFEKDKRQNRLLPGADLRCVLEKKIRGPHVRFLRAPLSARELKACVNLALIAGRFTCLRRSGRQLIGLCPLNSERNPSFYVHPEKQVFKCFGCGASGDVFAFVMQAFGCDFYRSLQIVAEFSDGVALARDPRSGSRLGVGEGAKPLRPPKAANSSSRPTSYSIGSILRRPTVWRNEAR